MRILDRYLLREFCLPVLYCLDAFALLWIVMDLFGSLDEFIAHHTPLVQVLQYYLVVFPEAFVQIVPMSLLLGLLFCLANLGKHNELTAMRANGISVARLSIPLLAVGLLATLVVFAINERFVPRAHEHARSLLRTFRGKGEQDTVEYFFFSNTAAHRDWYARRFHTRARELESPEIHERNPDGTPRRDIYAEKARWTSNQWVFFGVELYDQQPAGLPRAQRLAETNFPSLTERPNQLALAARKPDEMTSLELRRFVRAQKRAGRTAQLGPYEVTLQYRYAFPVTCLLVVWLGLPLGLSARRSGPLLSVGSALVLVVAFYFLTNITLALGSGQRIPPALAAWLTNLVFAAVGAVLFYRVK